MAKRTEEAAKLAGLIARKTGAPIEGSFEGNLQALINALNLHKVSNDHDQFSHVWTGFNQFLAGLETSGIMPVEAETADIGSPTRLFRKGFFSELSTLIFKKENVLVMDGTFVISKQSGKFPADVAAADTQIDFGQTLTVGDFLLLRAENKTEYMQVGALVSGTVYNVTRNLDGSGANDWPAESVYFVRGHSGDGWLELTAVDDLRLSVFTQGANWNQASEVVRVGKLDGWQGAGLTGYGFVIGDQSSDELIHYDNLTGKLVVSGEFYAADALRINSYGVQLKAASADNVDGTSIIWGANLAQLTMSHIIKTEKRSNGTVPLVVGTVDNPIELKSGVTATMTLDSTALTTNRPIAAANISTTPTMDNIPQAGIDGKINAGWIPDLSGVYLPVGGTAANSDKLGGLDSTEFVTTSLPQTINGEKTFGSLPNVPTTTPTAASEVVSKGYADNAYLGISSKAADADKLDGFTRLQLLSAIYPVGSVYISTNSANPSTYFGFGTWVRTAQGRMIAGELSTDADFTPGGKTGGSKTHAHGLVNAIARIVLGTSQIFQKLVTTPIWTATHQANLSRASSTITVTSGAEVAGDTDSRSNLSPYEVFYIWKRTA